MITVTISGKQESGKTKIMQVIEKYCKDNNFNYILKEETTKTFTVHNPDIIVIEPREQNTTTIENS